MSAYNKSKETNQLQRYTTSETGVQNIIYGYI